MTSYKNNKDILLVTAIIVFIDLILKDFFTRLNYNLPLTIVTDGAIIFIAGFIGKILSNKLQFFLWLGGREKYKNVKEAFITLVLALLVIIPNTIILLNSDTALSVAPWLRFENLLEPILISVRATLTEEIIFRLLLFLTLLYVILKIIKESKKPLIISAIICSIVFGSVHPGFYLAFINSIILCEIYLRNGLLVAMFVHFLADVIPFVIIFINSIEAERSTIMLESYIYIIILTITLGYTIVRNIQLFKKRKYNPYIFKPDKSDLPLIVKVGINFGILFGGYLFITNAKLLYIVVNLFIIYSFCLVACVSLLNYFSYIRMKDKQIIVHTVLFDIIVIIVSAGIWKYIIK